MRFELNLLVNGKVQITDRFYERDPLIVPNNDRCIRDGLKTFYNMDSFFNLEISEDQRVQYVAEMMDKLPKEDLSFKEVKKIE